MRTIDADELLHELSEIIRHNTGECIYGIEMAVNAVMDAPTIDGRNPELVRCKDCKYRPTAVEGKHGTEYVFPYEGKCSCQCDDDWYSWMPDDDWFCADGERR